MDLVIEPEAEEDLESFEEKHRSYIIQKLRELREKPASHEKSDTIRIAGRQVFKYVMKEGGKGGKDFRAVYDIESDTVRMVALFSRDQGYDKTALEKRL